MFADAPTVEMVVDAACWLRELPGRARARLMDKGAERIPFPLQGRLDEWIAQNGGGAMR